MNRVFGVLFCLCAAALAQEPERIRVTTRLVQVYVTAEDKHGKPVEGLTGDDFVLFDEGKKQQIRGFSVEKRERRAAAPAPRHW